MRTQTVNVDDRFGKEFEGKYVFKQISWAKRSRIIQKHTKYAPTGRILSQDFFTIQAETIMASLQEQPESKPLTLENILNEDSGIPVDLGEVLSKTVNQLNSLSDRGLRFLLEQLSEIDLTELLHSFGYVKSSV